MGCSGLGGCCLYRPFDGDLTPGATKTKQNAVEWEMKEFHGPEAVKEAMADGWQDDFSVPEPPAPTTGGGILDTDVAPAASAGKKGKK